MHLRTNISATPEGDNASTTAFVNGLNELPKEPVTYTWTLQGPRNTTRQGRQLAATAMLDFDFSVFVRGPIFHDLPLEPRGALLQGLRTKEWMKIMKQNNETLHKF